MRMSLVKVEERLRPNKALPPSSAVGEIVSAEFAHRIDPHMHASSWSS